VELLLAPLREMGEYQEIKQIIKKPEKAVSLTGCVESQKLHMIYGLSDGLLYKIIVTYSDSKAKELYQDYLLYDKRVTLFPAKDLIFYQADVHGNQLIMERMKCYRKILEKKPLTIITTFNSLMTPQIPLSILESNVITIDKKTVLNVKKLALKLVEMGYEKNYQVEAAGQFSIRGGIIDIFENFKECIFEYQ